MRQAWPAAFAGQRRPARLYTSMALRALGFDLDGTLYPAWRMYSASAYLALHHGAFLRAFGQARKALRKSNPAQQNPGSISQESLKEFRQRQAFLVASILNLDFATTTSLIDEVIYGKVEQSFSRIQPFKGLVPFLENLGASGFRLGLLSDLPPKKKLTLMGLDSYFHCALCSEDSGTLKPDGRPFLALADALGEQPESILYVGNKEAYDVKGAKSVGMKTALLGRSSNSVADFSFRRWEELSAWLFEGPGHTL